MQNDFPKLAAPAVRALLKAKISNMIQLSRFTEKQIQDLHGMGKNAIAQLKEEMHKRKLAFAKPIGNEVDSYVKTFPQKIQKVLKKVRATVKAVAPGAEEVISYQMPTYKLNGRPLVYFAAWKKHVGFYATPSGNQAFKKELSKYQGAKGSVKFPIDKSMPYDLIKKIVKYRLKEVGG